MPLSILFKKMEDLMTSTTKIKCREVHRAFICDKVHPDLKSWPGICRARVQKTNMFPNTIIAKCIIKYHMLSYDLASHTIIMSPAMTKSFRSACQKYFIHPEEEKKNRVESEMEMTARLITDNIDKIKLQQKDLLSKAITMMETESNECMQLVEKKKDLSYMFKGNTLKRKSEQAKKELAILQKEIVELEMKKKSNGLIYI